MFGGVQSCVCVCKLKHKSVCDGLSQTRRGAGQSRWNLRDDPGHQGGLMIGDQPHGHRMARQTCSSSIQLRATWRAALVNTREVVGRPGQRNANTAACIGVRHVHWCWAGAVGSHIGTSVWPAGPDASEYLRLRGRGSGPVGGLQSCRRGHLLLYGVGRAKRELTPCREGVQLLLELTPYVQPGRAGVHPAAHFRMSWHTQNRSQSKATQASGMSMAD
jgi:hypothetical protein